MPLQTPMAREQRQYATSKDIRGRWPLLALTGVLMLAILGGVLFAAGMFTHPVESQIAEPVYLRPDNRPSDVASTGAIPNDRQVTPSQ